MRHRYMKCHLKDIRKCPKQSILCTQCKSNTGDYSEEFQQSLSKSGNCGNQTAIAMRCEMLKAIRDARMELDSIHKAFAITVFTRSIASKLWTVRLAGDLIIFIGSVSVESLTNKSVSFKQLFPSSLWVSLQSDHPTLVHTTMLLLRVEERTPLKNECRRTKAKERMAAKKSLVLFLCGGMH